MALMLNKHGQLERIHIPAAPPQRRHSRSYVALAVFGRVLLIISALLLHCIVELVRDEMLPLLGVFIGVGVCLTAVLSVLLVMLGG